MSLGICDCRHTYIHTYTHTHTHRDYDTIRNAVRMSLDGQTILIEPGERIWFGRALAEANSFLNDRFMRFVGKRQDRQTEAGARRVRGRGVNHTLVSIGGVTGEENMTRIVEMGALCVVCVCMCL